jgi:hypothetical protein
MNLYVVIVILLGFTLLGIGLYELFKTSTTTTTPSAPPPPVGVDQDCCNKYAVLNKKPFSAQSWENIPSGCINSKTLSSVLFNTNKNPNAIKQTGWNVVTPDMAKCGCSSNPKCLKSPRSCMCLPGQTYDCSSNQCVTNCICPNGIPSDGVGEGGASSNPKCGNIPGKVAICASCSYGYVMINGKCKQQCGPNFGTCQGVTNPQGSGGAHKATSKCCLGCAGIYKCCGHNCAGEGHGCEGDGGC